MVANGQLETSESMVELTFECDDFDINEIIVVMEKRTSQLVGPSFLRKKNTILDMRQDDRMFFSKQLKTADQFP